MHLTDFGIARLTHGPALTRLTGLIGTPEYLAPELAEREHATPAADVYASGIVLYELLTGFTPFAGGHPVAVLRRHIEDAPRRPDGLPDPLWSLLSAMLEKDPTRRPTASDAARKLFAMAPTLEGLAPWHRRCRDRDSEESATSLRIRPDDKTERATIFKNGKSTTKAAGSGWNKKRTAVIAAAMVLVLAGLAAVSFSMGGSAATHTNTYAFTPESFPSGLIVNRTWELTGSPQDQLTRHSISPMGPPAPSTPSTTR